MLKGFKNFLMRGDVIVVAVGLVVALAFSNLVKAFTDNIINPLIAAAQGGVKGPGLGWQLSQRRRQRHVPQPRRVHLRDHLLHHLYGGRVLPDHRALQVRHGSTGQDGVRRPAPDQDLPGVPVRRPEPRREQVQVLRLGRPRRHRLTDAYRSGPGTLPASISSGHRGITPRADARRRFDACYGGAPPRRDQHQSGGSARAASNGTRLPSGTGISATFRISATRV